MHACIIKCKWPTEIIRATATRSIRKEVVSKLGMQGCAYVYESPDRPNIFYEIRQATTMEADLKEVVESPLHFQI